ncbi:MAG: hypothetical protein ACHQ52_10500 [Candidatus Eisenbacteria bacterium]
MSDRLSCRRAAFLALAITSLAIASAARAQVDPPSSGDLFSFPGAFPNPASPMSAGRALADRWLGDAPWDDPAAGGGWSVEGSLLYLRDDRQDLRAANRQFDGGSGLFDFGSAALSAPLPGRVTLWLYSFPAEARSEDVAFYAGRGTDPTQPSALVTAKTDTREVRSGGGFSRAFGALRLGVAVEVTNRTDDWTRTLESGAPESGTRTTSWKGNATGGQAGFRWTHGDSGAGQIVVGGGLRRLPELEVSGSNHTDLLIGSTDSSLTTHRESGWEGGVSASWRVNDAVRLFAGGGTRTAMAWSGLAMTSGRWATGALAVDYHDPTTPWTVRAGYALDQQSEVPEESAGSLGLSFGWDFTGAMAEVGVLHRAVHRSSEPTSHEDRVLVGIRATF